MRCCRSAPSSCPLPWNWSSRGYHTTHRALEAASRSQTAGGGAEMQHALQQELHQQGQQQQQQPGGNDSGIRSWNKHMTAAYMTLNRNWTAVEDFYLQLVAGRQCLSSIGLSPSKLAVDQGQDIHQQEQQQQQHDTASLPSRVTYKLHVSYLGGSFCGWQKGNSHSKPSVQDTLARAIAAIGLCERSATKSKRAAARAERRQQAQQRAKQLAAAAAAIDDDNDHSSGGGLSDPDGLAAASTTRSNALAAAGGQSSVCPPAMDPSPQQDAAAGSGGSSAAVQPQQQPQLPSLQSGGRTDAGVTAVGQVVSFYSWQPPVSGTELASRINNALQQQWAAAAAAAETRTSSHRSSGSSSSSSSSSSSPSGADSSPQEQQPHTAAGVAPGPAPAAVGCSTPLEQLPPVCPLCVSQAALVPRQFHATFSASWRRYLYLLPLRQDTPAAGAQQLLLTSFTAELQQPCNLSDEQLQAVQCTPDVDPSVVNALLGPLQGLRLNYTAFARDTQQDKDCECTLLLARASLVWVPQPGSLPLHRDSTGGVTSDQGQGHKLPRGLLQQQQGPHEQHHSSSSIPRYQEAALQQQQQQQQQGGGDGWPCLAVELVADRFLRRMVRVLVGTLVREAVAVAQVGGGGGREQLLQLVEGMDRRATAAAAPPLGLCFAAVGYEEGADEPGA